MEPIVFGLDYATAPFDIREKMAFLPDEIPSILERLIFSGIVSEALILSTCNRTEVYMHTHDTDFAINSICGIKNVCPMTIRKHSYMYKNVECVRHLFRVASGLESMVLGETEIVAQIKDSFKVAKEHKAIATNLSGLFQMALAVEKDVRNYTEINSIASSMGQSLVKIAASRVSNLKESKIVFIGAGAMMSKIVPHFKGVASEQTIINRTVAKAKMLANKVSITYGGLEELKYALVNSDIIITSCGAEKPIIVEEVLAENIKNKKQLLIIDISMPPITDLNLNRHENITILTIDDIGKIVDVGVEKRKLAATSADKFIEEKINDYSQWLKKRGLSPVIKALRDNAEDIRQDMLAQAQKQLLNGDNVDEVLNTMSIKLINKLLHAPTVNLAKTENKDDLVNLISYLYNLEDKV